MNKDVQQLEKELVNLGNEVEGVYNEMEKRVGDLTS